MPSPPRSIRARPPQNACSKRADSTSRNTPTGWRASTTRSKLTSGVDPLLPPRRDAPLSSRSAPMAPTPKISPSPSTLRSVGLIAGPVVFFLIMLGQGIEGLSEAGTAALAITLLMAIWWLTEAIPIYVTALVPIVLFPLTGVLPAAETTLNYGHELIYLFLGGFLLSIAVEKWHLHRRVALSIIAKVGFEPARLVLGFMVATGFLSMWISNTASAMMMVPIGLAVVTQVAALTERHQPEIDTSPGGFHFGMSLMLGIAYSASIGGIATIIGSPPNAIFVGYVDRVHSTTISFLQWMYYGLPIAVVGILIAWFYLTKKAYPIRIGGMEGIANVVDEGLRELGPMRHSERRVLAIFALVAGLWVLRGALAPYLSSFGLGGFSDTTVAILGAILLFIVPSHCEPGEPLLVWEDVREVPWGILLLFGGGLALASGIEASGLATWLAEGLGFLEGAPGILVILVLVAVVIFLTEVTSNTSTATIFVPVVAILATVVGLHPYTLMISVVTAASCAFMLPVATPPNAVVFASNYVTMNDMMRAGLRLNIAFIVLIALLGRFWLPVAWGI
ncbi:SLC13/DASS family transporter [Bradymonadaceae bacterium TMQ3]|nr:SLC13/DASS family transporter [Bradymonadaceae bacterium TMQ3]TXC77631.1 SLC13/DASS family transporter [Bradymonadales bacterium TMQ1]